MTKIIISKINGSVKNLERLAASECIDQINQAALQCIKTIKKGGKILICGNGGSSADASHLAAEFLVRLRPNINRLPLAAIPLTIDAPTLTACGNDYGFKYIFLRNYKALERKNDTL